MKGRVEPILTMDWIGNNVEMSPGLERSGGLG